MQIASVHVEAALYATGLLLGRTSRYRESVTCGSWIAVGLEWRLVCGSYAACAPLGSLIGATQADDSTPQLRQYHVDRQRVLPSQALYDLVKFTNEPPFDESTKVGSL